MRVISIIYEVIYLVDNEQSVKTKECYLSKSMAGDSQATIYRFNKNVRKIWVRVKEDNRGENA